MKLEKSTIMKRLNGKIRQIKENAEFDTVEINRRGTQWRHGMIFREQISNDYTLLFRVGMFNLGLIINYREEVNFTATMSFYRGDSYEKSKKSKKSKVFYSREYEDFDDFSEKLREFCRGPQTGLFAVKNFINIMEIDTECEPVDVMKSQQIDLKNEASELQKNIKKGKGEIKGQSDLLDVDKYRNEIKEIEKLLARKKSELGKILRKRDVLTKDVSENIKENEKKLVSVQGRIDDLNIMLSISD